MRMKNFFLCWLVLGGLAFGQSPLLRSPWTTNDDAAVSAFLAPGVFFVDSISGNDNNPGTLARPFATLAGAQNSATNGSLIYALRGTFNETGLGKSGVSWYFSRGVVAGNTSPFFLVGATNSTTNLTVLGEGTFSNNVVTYVNATNTTVHLCGDVFASPSVGLFSETPVGFSVSNRAWVNGGQISGFGFSTAGNVTSSNNNWWFYFSATRATSFNTTSGNGSGNSNRFFYITAPEVRAGAANFTRTLNTVLIESPNFSINSQGMASIQSNYWWNITVMTTNDFATNLNYNGTVRILR